MDKSGFAGKHHQRYQFFSNQPGPQLLILGAIHGNEICGPLALRKLIEELESGSLELRQGSLSLVPVCNLEAFQQDKRFIEQNLNRVIHKEPSPASYEERLAQRICSFIDEADILLDLHSFHSAGEPFMVWTGDSNSFDFTRSLGDYDLITGFSEVYETVPHIDAHTTLAYAQKQNKAHALIECGSHRDPRAPSVAYEAIRRALSFTGLVDYSYEASGSDRNLWSLFELQIKERQGQLMRELEEFSFIKASEVIAQYDDGQKLLAPKDCYSIFPGKEALVGTEWYFLAEKRKLDQSRG